MPERAYERVDLAIEQLDMAIELYMSGRSDVSALTLAGAAEEILGKALGLRGEANVLEMDHAIEKAGLGTRFPGLQTLKEYAGAENEARNAAKHLDKDCEHLTADLRQAAERMITRACDNHFLLFGPATTDRMREFAGRPSELVGRMPASR